MKKVHSRQSHSFFFWRKNVIKVSSIYMSLQSKIENKLNDALKSKDKATYSTLRLVVAAIKDMIIAKKIKDKSNLSDP